MAGAVHPSFLTAVYDALLAARGRCGGLALVVEQCLKNSAGCAMKSRVVRWCSVSSQATGAMPVAACNLCAYIQVMPNGFVHVTEVVGERGAGQDRAGAQHVGDDVVIALADGAGGTGGGAKAAQAVVDAVFAAASEGPAWEFFLAELDRDVVRLGGGQSTAIVLSVTGAGIVGAAVGDSGAWIIRDVGIEDLTAGQPRKPLLGAGCVPSVVRGRPLGGGTLLVASDGLIKYASQACIARIANGPDLALAARSLVDLVRLPSGALQDDVSIVLCRVGGNLVTR